MLRTCFIFIATLLTVSSAGAAQNITLVEDEDLGQWIRSWEKRDIGFATRSAEAKDALSIVFVPGILGSKLKIGSFVYGEHALSSSSLAYRPGQKVEASTLNSYKAEVFLMTKQVDIYREALDALMATNAGRLPIEFSYDWREDIDRSADVFQAFLKERAGGKNVVIVAHSMGGLLAWHWKNKYRGTRPVNVVAFVLLGSPLQGACEATRMLVESYGPPQGQSNFEAYAIRALFESAHAAILTFPSVFQMMPEYRDGDPCVSLLRSGRTYALDHHAPDAWLGRPGGDYGAVGRFSAQSGMSAKEYEQAVTNAANLGRSFRASFDQSQHDDRVFLFFSTKPAIGRHLVLVPDGNGWLRRINHPAQIMEDGDGRVSKRSATHESKLKFGCGAALELESVHGRMPADARFGGFMSDNVKGLLQQSARRRILAAAVAQPAMRKELLARQWVLPLDLPTCGEAGKGGAQQDARLIGEYNQEVATGSTNSNVQALRQLARTLESSVTEKPTRRDVLAANLHKSAMAITGQEDSATWNRVGIALRGNASLVEQLAAFSRSTSIIADGGNPFPVDRSLQGKIYSNQGRVLEALGAFDAAKASYQRSGALGHAPGRYNASRIGEM